MKKYDRLLSRLFACCEIQDNYPHSPVLINTEKISDVLETAFLEAGLLKINKKRVLDQMGQLIGKVRKVEKYHENRVYIPRLQEGEDADG